jgi:hypothetical protein
MKERGTLITGCEVKSKVKSCGGRRKTPAKKPCKAKPKATACKKKKPAKQYKPKKWVYVLGKDGEYVLGENGKRMRTQLVGIKG